LKSEQNQNLGNKYTNNPLLKIKIGTLSKVVFFYRNKNLILKVF